MEPARTTDWPDKRSAERVRNVLDALSEAKTIPAIAAEADVSEPTVRRVLDGLSLEHSVTRTDDGGVTRIYRPVSADIIEGAMQHLDGASEEELRQQVDRVAAVIDEYETEYETANPSDADDISEEEREQWVNAKNKLSTIQLALSVRTATDNL